MEKAPGRLPKRRSRLVWIVPGVLVLALGATAVWRVARGPRSDLDPARQRAAEAAAARGALADLLAKVRVEPDPMAYVQARAGKEDTDHAQRAGERVRRPGLRAVMRWRPAG